MSADQNLTDLLDVRAGQPADLVLRRATLLDPVAGIDGVHDLVIRDGRIAELAPPGEADATDVEDVGEVGRATHAGWPIVGAAASAATGPSPIEVGRSGRPASSS